MDGTGALGTSASLGIGWPRALRGYAVLGDAARRGWRVDALPAWKTANRIASAPPVPKMAPATLRPLTRRAQLVARLAAGGRVGAFQGGAARARRVMRCVSRPHLPHTDRSARRGGVGGASGGASGPGKEGGRR